MKILNCIYTTLFLLFLSSSLTAQSFSEIEPSQNAVPDATWPPIYFNSYDKVIAQSSCNDYLDFMDKIVIELFTSEQVRTSRESAFPSNVHQVLESEVRRLRLPQEQLVCDKILNVIYKNDPVKGPPIHHALYKVKDHYFMVIYKYYTARDGTQLIEDPTVGGLFDPQFRRVGLIAM